jgi:hypothetical protein
MELVKSFTIYNSLIILPIPKALLNDPGEETAINLPE